SDTSARYATSVAPSGCGVRRRVAAICTLLPSRLSSPRATDSSSRGGSIRVIDTSVAALNVMYATFVLIVARYRFSPTCSTFEHPGTHPTICVGSTRKSQTRCCGALTEKLDSMITTSPQGQHNNKRERGVLNSSPPP